MFPLAVGIGRVFLHLAFLYLLHLPKLNFILVLVLLHRSKVVVLVSALLSSGASYFCTMQFWIEVEHSWRKYRYLVEHHLIDERKEHYILKASNKTLVIESNRPYFRSHPGLKKRRPELKLVEGKIWNMSFLAKIYEAIEPWFEKLPIQ